MARVYTDGKYRYLVQRANVQASKPNTGQYFIMKECIQPYYGMSGKPRFKSYHAESRIYYDTAEEAQDSLDFVAEQRLWQPYDD